MYSITLIHSDKLADTDREELFLFCSDHRDLKNYSDVNWRNNKSSLLYKFLKTDEFTTKNGGLFLLRDNEQLIHLSGFNRSEFHPDIYICGVRTITKKDYKHNLLMSKYSVPAQYKEILKLNGKMMIFCFEADSEFSMYDVIKNNKFNLFLKNQLKEFNVKEIYKELTPLEFPVYINYTVHNVLYKLLDKNFRYNWDSIRAINHVQIEK